MLSAFSIYILWLAAVFDPTGWIYGLRYVALGCVLFVLAINFFFNGPVLRIHRPYISLFFFFVYCLPFYGMTVAFIRGGLWEGNFIDTSYLVGGIYFACSLIYFSNENLSVAFRAHIFSLRCLSLIIILALIFLLANLPLDWIYFFVVGGAAFLGERNYGGINFYYIYFIASPMIMFLLAHEAWVFFEKPSLRKFLLLMLPVIALFLSGTRANMLISVVGIFLVFFWRRYKFMSLLYFLGLLFLFFIGISIFDFNVVADMLNSADASNAIKIGYLNSYFEIFLDPATLLFGQGFNAHVWSQPFSSMLEEGASKTELTYFEFLRVFGMVGVMAFVAIIYRLFSSIRAAPQNYQWLAPGLLLYLFVSATNPYIFSSNGMLLIGLAAVAVSRCSSQRNSNFNIKQ
ncbi:hypothetical protein SAMN04515620_103101 [Collimonas sp. OK607]|nr:hypothetical protein SAMN04515620_103101 [Collimonas sp. OK607]